MKQSVLGIGISAQAPRVYNFPQLMSRFVVLRHTVPKGSRRVDHFDLMLETGDVLDTWEIQSWPPTDGQIAFSLPGHRKEYLEFQGPLSRERGFVERVERGTYQSQPGCALVRQFSLNGGLYQGTIQLRKVSADRQNDLAREQWLLQVVESPTATEPSED